MQRDAFSAFSLQTVSFWLAAAFAAPFVAAQPAPPAKPLEPPPTIAKATKDLVRSEGPLVVYLDANRGRVYLEFPPAQGEVLAEHLVMQGLRSGLGSNPVGLDRGQLSGAKVLRWRRIGDKVLAELPNLAFRATSSDPAERQAVAESFGTSVIWAAPIHALDPDGRLLIDATSFVVRDAHGVVERLDATGQGSFELDRERSGLDPASVKVFPQNVELDAVLTFASKKPGAEVRTTIPAPAALTLEQHLSLITLPPPGYQPRNFDRRMGSFGIRFADYSSPLGTPLEQRWIARHRLEKRDPSQASSPAIEPIVYYVDPGAPEPIRSALLDGARWWAKAFEAAGFPDSYRVELLPAGADPLDVRYNVIQWVHRSTRGWSYGEGVMDPRTGEIIKGHVSLGSLRVRQDILLFEGLVGAAATGSGGPNDPIEVALARIRQLSAHEVGHTLGFDHNFSASTFADRASVMDYPAPKIALREDGTFDLSDAYGVGVGAWDLHQTRWAYGTPGPGETEEEYLEALVQQGFAQGYVFHTDADARPLGGAQPRASLWDNGDDPVGELEHALAVRARGLATFSLDRLAPGRSTAALEEVLVPLYFHHRYQLDATAKLVAGIDYRYARVGDGQASPTAVPPTDQRRAIAALLAALDPAALELPDSIVALLGPHGLDEGGRAELFAGNAGPTFDGLAAAATAADMVLAALLEPSRLARAVEQHLRDGAQPSMEEIVTAIERKLFEPSPTEPYRAEIQRTTQWVFVDHLVALASGAPRPVRARAEEALEQLHQQLVRAPGGEPASRAHRAAIRRDLERFLRERTWEAGGRPRPLPAPPGSPIGQACGHEWGG